MPRQACAKNVKDANQRPRIIRSGTSHGLSGIRDARLVPQDLVVAVHRLHAIGAYTLPVIAKLI
jgi:hypothetical protein